MYEDALEGVLHAQAGSASAPWLMGKREASHVEAQSGGVAEA